MENGSILIVMIIAALVGRRSVYVGVVSGVVATIVLFFVFQDFQLKLFAFELLFGTMASVVASVLARIIFPGLAGGNHNSGPTFIGGGDRFCGMQGGIVPTDEELRARKENEREIP